MYNIINSQVLIRSLQSRHPVFITQEVVKAVVHPLPSLRRLTHNQPSLNKIGSECERRGWVYMKFLLVEDRKRRFTMKHWLLKRLKRLSHLVKLKHLSSNNKQAERAMIDRAQTNSSFSTWICFSELARLSPMRESREEEVMFSFRERHDVLDTTGATFWRGISFDQILD